MAVNETFTLDGQTLTVTDVEIYPTHVRVNVEGDGDNTAWLKGLDFYLENEDGQRFGSISSGVIASGDTDTPAMVSYRLESRTRPLRLPDAAHHRRPVAGKGP